MGNTIKALFYGATSILDITGSRGVNNLKKISDKNISNGYKTDKNSLSNDFYTAISNF